MSYTIYYISSHQNLSIRLTGILSFSQLPSFMYCFCQYLLRKTKICFIFSGRHINIITMDHYLAKFLGLHPPFLGIFGKVNPPFKNGWGFKLWPPFPHHGKPWMIHLSFLTCTTTQLIQLQCSNPFCPYKLDCPFEHCEPYCLCLNHRTITPLKSCYLPSFLNRSRAKKS